MKKIGILTFHHAENYGAFLQAYALENWLKRKIRCNVEIIDYRPVFQIRPYKISPRKNIKLSRGLKAKLFSLIDFFFELPNKVRKRIRYNKAKKKLDLSDEKFFSNDFTLKDYNVLILGSDQIWNPEITYGLDKAYFGFNVDKACKKVSYAASCGVMSYADHDEKLFNELLNNIDTIGVREQQSVDLLKQYTDKDIMVNIDPTLLIGREFWKAQIHPVKEKNYILVYMLSENKSLMEDAKELSKKTGKRILHFRSPGLKKIKIIKSLSFSGPFDFISYIYHADYVLTDSFHATCFSLIFKKDFYTYLGLKRSERLLSLAGIGEFGERLVEYRDHINLSNSEIDYYLNLISEIKKSEEYLINSIGD